jgi:hypothetical protein
VSTGRRTVTVTRSGGFAGMRAEHTVDLETVDTQQAEAWRRLLADDVLRLLPRAERPRPDGYVYRLVCEADDLDVTLPEHKLPAEHRALLDQTLRLR